MQHNQQVHAKFWAKAATGLLVVANVLLGACQRSAPSATEQHPSESEEIHPEPTTTPKLSDKAATARGKRLVRRFECSRCHQASFLTPSVPERDCVGCHQRINSGNLQAPANVLKEWQASIQHLKLVPSLEHAGEMFTSQWLVDYLIAPADLRPGLEATMPRLNVTRDQAADIAAFLTSTAHATAPNSTAPNSTALNSAALNSAALNSAAPKSANPSDASALTRGRQLFQTKACGACHRFEQPAQWENTKPITPAQRLAPDLRHARKRLRPGVLRRWLANPQALKHDTLMPNPELSTSEIEALATYLTTLPLPQKTHAEPPRLPLLKRDVLYAEVESRIFRKTCWHCHSQPDLARGDGGPGMTGGFGFAGRRLDLSTYAGVLSGAQDSEAKPLSVFRPSTKGNPMLVEVLLARQREEAGHLGPVRGMPLGLPSLAPQEIQLLESWIAQGRPQ